MAQQALSSQIRQLERRAERVTLFERSTRRVALTDAGERLLPHARIVLEALDKRFPSPASSRSTSRA